ncbi:MAG TPA: cytochrome c biogenesis protein ResB [Ktedonobacteraceae bacterium]|nr:cytochrome c biogenesis protein ResB [Ktedonobacteraceae bacterium]
MPTISKAPPKRAPINQELLQRSRTRKRPAPVGPRLKQKALYWWKHPLNALWGWLSSVRTAILLIAAITIICLLGIYFTQAPGEVLGDPTAYNNWVQLNELPHYGSLTPIFDWFQFYTIFSSWYFMLLMVLLALSIVVCTLNRFPAIWQNVRHPILRRSDKFYENALERVTFEHEDAVAWTGEQLRKHGFRVRKVVETNGDKQEVTFLYANKNTWATLATFVFHAALVTLLLAGTFSQWHGFPANSPARSFLPAPILNATDALAGFSFSQALANGDSATVYPRGTLHNITFRSNHFTAKFDPRTGLATDYVTDLSVYQDGKLVAHSDHLRVNDPLTYGNIVFHQSSLLPAVNVTISDASGCLMCGQSIVLDSTESADGLEVDLAKGIQIADTGYTLSVFFPHKPGVQIAQIQQPTVFLVVDEPGEGVQTNNTQKMVAGQSVTVHQNWKMTLNGTSQATILLVTKDSGSVIIWPTAVLLILSLCATFYFPQRRIWLKIIGRRVQAAALREHFVNIRTDLLTLERASKSTEKQPEGLY